MKNILVIGGAGFIGSNFIRTLLQIGQDRQPCNQGRVDIAITCFHLQKRNRLHPTVAMPTSPVCKASAKHRLTRLNDNTGDE